jgi:hypothetical protein
MELVNSLHAGSRQWKIENIGYRNGGYRERSSGYGIPFLVHLHTTLSVRFPVHTQLFIVYFEGC